MILVSHDRYFVSKTANKIWEIVDQEIKEFKGGYEEWVQWKERMAKQEIEKQKAANAEKPAVKEAVKAKEEVKPVKEQPTVAAPVNKELKKELQKAQKQFQQLEERIAQLNQQRATLEASLANPSTYSDKSKFLETEAAYKKADQELKQLNDQYEKQFEKIMQLEEKQS